MGKGVLAPGGAEKLAVGGGGEVCDRIPQTPHKCLTLSGDRVVLSSDCILATQIKR